MAYRENPSQALGYPIETDDDCFPGLLAAKVPPAPPAPARLNRLAIGAGFSLAMMVFGALAPQLSEVVAGEGGGNEAMHFLLQEGAKRTGAARNAGFFQAPTAYAPASETYRATAAAGSRKTSGQRVQVASITGDPVPLGRRSVCVRLCDGFFFPVGDLHDDSEIASHEAVCSTQCPGAPAQLYIQPAGSDHIEDATSARGHNAYTALPVAFRHGGKSEAATCSCQAHVINRSVAILRDFTLRKGDTVATPIGMRVFRGAQHWPFKRNDFISLAQSRDLNDQDRGTLTALERAAKGLKPAAKPVRAESAAPPAPKTSKLAPDERAAKSIRVVGPQALLATPPIPIN